MQSGARPWKPAHGDDRGLRYHSSMALDDEQRRLVNRSRPLRGPVHRRKPRPPQSEVDEGPSEEDLERFGDVTVRCKECDAELFDDVEICFQCGRSVMASDRTKGLPPWVLVVIALVALVLVYELLVSPMWGPLLWRPRTTP
jgi:hypothetical protein